MKKKLSLLFALLCASMMGWAYDKNASFPEAGSYANQFSWSSIGGVTPPRGVNSVESKSGFDCIYVNVGQTDFDPSTGIVGCELAGYEGAGVWIKINSLILEDNEIYFKKSDGTKLRGLIIHNSAAGGGGNLTPTLGEKFVAANASIAGTYFATGGKWTTDPGSNASYDAATGVISVHIDQEKIAQWQGQVKLALGFVYSAEKYYDFSIKFHASKAVNGVTLKSSNDNALFFENQSVNLSANEDYVWTKSDVAGVAGDNTFVFDFGLAAAGTDITISEISIIEKDEPSTPAVVETYCRKATGHLGQANFGDIYGRILLTIKKVNETTIAVRVEPNNNGTKGIKYLNIIVNGTSHEFGNNDGSGEDLTGFYEISGLASLDFTFNLSFYCNTPNWTTNQFTVKESELCTEESVILTEGSEYCEYGVACARGDGDFAYLSWNTTVDGDVVISIVDGVNSTNARFRGNGFEGDFDAGFKVLSGANFSTEEVASKYFNRILPSGDKKSFTLQRKGGAVLPSPAKIRFSGPALAWLCDQHDDGYRFESFTYTYGKICPVVSGYAVSASSNNATMGSATATVNSKPVTHVDAGTPVTFTATTTDNTYTFVNWTKGGVEVSTNPIYELEINEATALVANFDYVRTTYCHSEVLTNNGKKLYLSVSKVADNTYKIRIDGSAEARINGRNNFNFVINNTSDYSNAAYDEVTKSGWKVSNEGNGYIENTFTANDYKALTFGSHYFAIGAQGGGEFILDNNFPLANTIAWNSTCSDTEAPAFNKAEAEVLNESSVRLKIQATDNWGGLLTYTIAREAAEPIISNHASGEEFTQDVTGLTAGTKYTFTITVSDGVNNANQNIVVTPMGDSEPPVMGEARLESKNWNSAIINVAATDNKGVTAYYVVEKAADYIATDGKITVEGLTAATPYTFHIKAKDAAGNISENQAEVSFTTDAHLLAPATAAPVPTWRANQVKSLYSNTYDFAPASLSSYNECWWNCPNMSEGNIDGNTYLLYDLYRNGIIGVQFEETSMSLMEKIHIDIWASAAGNIKFRPITNGGPNTPKTLNLAAQQWNSFDIDLSEYAGHDWSKVFQFAIEGYQDGGLVGEHISVDNIFFYRTTPPPADEAAPTDVIANKTEENFASVKLSAQANDDSGVVHFRVQNGSDVLVADVEAVSGAEVAITINNLTPNTNYTLSVVAFDEAGHEAEPVNVAVKTKALPSAAPQPTHVAEAVLSVYSNAYDPAVAATFNRANWGSAPVELESDYILYSMTSNVIVWGNSDGNAGYGNIDGLSGKTHGETPGLDVSGMTYIHFDVWCEVADQLNTVNINDQAVAIPTTRTIAGEWVSFDVDITGVALADRQNVRWLKFHPFTNCFAAIDNVYFWSYGVTPNAAQGTDAGGWATFASPVDLAVPDGLTAYKASYQKTETEEILNLSPISVIPANAGVILKGNAGEAYTFAPATEPAPDMSGNVLVGCVTRTDVSAVRETKDIFCMRYSASYDFTGFFLYEGQYVPANRAYLPLDKVSGSNNAPAGTARRVRFVINEEQVATGVENAKADSMEIVKFFENGQLYIRRGEAVYNLQGVRVK